MRFQFSWVPFGAKINFQKPHSSHLSSPIWRLIPHTTRLSLKPHFLNHSLGPRASDFQTFHLRLPISPLTHHNPHFTLHVSHLSSPISGFIHPLSHREIASRWVAWCRCYLILVCCRKDCWCVGNRQTLTHQTHVSHAAWIHNVCVLVQGDALLASAFEMLHVSAMPKDASRRHTNLRFPRHREFMSLQCDSWYVYVFSFMFQQATNLPLVQLVAGDICSLSP